MKPVITLLLMFVALISGAEETIDLWQEEAPYSKPNSLEEYVKESWGVPCAHNVTKPTLTIHSAQGENTGRAVVVLPGGGYVLESIVAEGQLIAESLSSQGITAAVLKYRLPLLEASDQPHLVPITDARKAISLMKSMAEKYGVDRSKVGVMGFSAGGHLATAVSVLRSDNKDENPDFSALIYPVTTLGAENQNWLEEDLFHRPMTADEMRLYSLVEHVDGATPPAFLLHAYDDEVVPVSESIVFAEALTAVGQDVEVHFFARGGHGFGPGRLEDGTGQWLALLADWIKRQ
ncbi:MAG: alpha/beta hydrolase [Acidobacteria bacterium]|nr:alpha/beta hydrolase [Candidatus Sulfomarinibacter sp. MAG AM2]